MDVNTSPKLRIVVAKPGLDGHDRGVKIVARALRDAGHEVIYTGLQQTPQMIVETAIQEDADLIGLSVLSGAHRTLFPRIVQELAARGLDDVIVFGGGTIPPADIAVLQQAGVAAVFTPGASMASITDWLTGALEARAARTPDLQALLQPGETLAWVNNQILATGKPEEVKVKVGADAGTLSGELPDIEITEPELQNDAVSGINATGTATNNEEEQLERLTIFGVARDGDEIVAAGRAAIDNLNPGRQKVYRVYFIGDPKGAELSVTSFPTLKPEQGETGETNG